MSREQSENFERSAQDSDVGSSNLSDLDVDDHSLSSFLPAKKSSGPGPGLPRKKKETGSVIVNISYSNYEILREVISERGWKVCERRFIGTKKKEMNPDAKIQGWECTHKGSCTPYWNIMWHDHGGFGEHFRHILDFQRFNHFPGMVQLARKTGMSVLFSKMARLFPKQYSFQPETWILPLEITDFRHQFDASGRSTTGGVFIVKPDAGCQGRGIILSKRLDKIESMLSSEGKSVAQRYIDNPLLIDGLKFDLRLYVLITSCSPLRVFLYDDGLVRMCTQRYTPPKEENLGNVKIHLTNYSVNKDDGDFAGTDEEGGTGHKRSIKWLLGWMELEGLDAHHLWRQIADACAKTVICVAPTIQREYRWRDEPGSSRFYCILGIDMMVDEQCNPWLIEVNHLPSFRTDTPLDHRIKKRLIHDTLALLNPQEGDRENFLRQQDRETKQRLLGGISGKGNDSQAFSEPNTERATTPTNNRYVALRQLEEFEASNQGGYTRICPPEDKAPNNTYGDSYDSLLAASQDVHDTLLGKNKRPLTPKVRGSWGSPLSCQESDQEISTRDDTGEQDQSSPKGSSRNWEKEKKKREKMFQKGQKNLPPQSVKPRDPRKAAYRQAVDRKQEEKAVQMDEALRHQQAFYQRVHNYFRPPRTEQVAERPSDRQRALSIDCEGSLPNYRQVSDSTQDTYDRRDSQAAASTPNHSPILLPRAADQARTNSQTSHNLPVYGSPPPSPTPNPLPKTTEPDVSPLHFGGSNIWCRQSKPGLFLSEACTADSNDTIQCRIKQTVANQQLEPDRSRRALSFQSQCSNNQRGACDDGNSQSFNSKEKTRRSIHIFTELSLEQCNKSGWKHQGSNSSTEQQAKLSTSSRQQTDSGCEEQTKPPSKGQLLTVGQGGLNGTNHPAPLIFPSNEPFERSFSRHENNEGSPVPSPASRERSKTDSFHGLTQVFVPQCQERSTSRLQCILPASLRKNAKSTGCFQLPRRTQGQVPTTSLMILKAPGFHVAPAVTHTKENQRHRFRSQNFVSQQFVIGKRVSSERQQVRSASEKLKEHPQTGNANTVFVSHAYHSQNTGSVETPVQVRSQKNSKPASGKGSKKKKTEQVVPTFLRVDGFVLASKSNFPIQKPA